jgi:hypothetical protein
MRESLLLLSLALSGFFSHSVLQEIKGTLTQQPPTVPIGLDAYRQWDKWYQQRIGVRAYMRSTYDRRGGNEGADASHFLYQLADDNNVSLDVAGPGILYFVRTNHWHGSPWRYTVDGKENLIQETSTADPNRPAENSTFLPAALFPSPLAWTWSATKGADLNWVPMPFTQSFRMGYSRTHYGTGYYIYHQFVPGIKLSQPLKAWNGQPPAQDVLDLINRAGTDIAPRMGTPEGRRLGLSQSSGTVTLPREGALPLFSKSGAKGVIRAIEFSVPRSRAIDFGRARIRITWDDRSQPSVDAPVALFFGAGTLYNRDNREYLVKAFPVNIRFDDARVHLACYIPMPFLKSARIELVGAGAEPIQDVRWSVRTQALRDVTGPIPYFHATYKDHHTPEPGKDMVLLNTDGVEGSKEWSGSFIGTSFIFSHNANLGTLEGDPRFFFDGSQTPQAQGTGTEEWGGGGDYWGGINMTLPFAGHPTGARSLKEARSDEDKIESAYRFLLADLMPFGRSAKICLEHGGTNESTDHYETVTYWYGAPTATLVETDNLQIGDVNDERRHQYASPSAFAPYSISSRYELGVDTLKGKEIYPATSDVGRKTTGASEFTLQIDPKNLGVMLRRKLDYMYPNQRAEVFVADVSEAQPEGNLNWKPAGTWYTAGSNTCVYSNPGPELGAAQHIVQTSNRRFRDDELLLPLNLTKGRKAIRIRVKFTPVAIPLYPGYPLPERAWSEMHYTAFSYVLPGLH